jgi:hypothetical protein
VRTFSHIGQKSSNLWGFHEIVCPGRFCGCACFARSAYGETNRGSFPIEAGNNEELANNFTVMVETAVETSNKFRVIERRQLGNLVNEQAMGNSGMVTTNTPASEGV